MLLIVPFPSRAPGASCGSQVCTDFIAIPPRAFRARPFLRRICSSSCRSLPAPRARRVRERRPRPSAGSLPARAGRARSAAGYAPHRAVPSPRAGRVLRQPGVYGFHRNPSPRVLGAPIPPPDMLLIVPFPPCAPGAFCGSQVCTDFIAFPPARRARPFRRRICSSSCRSLPAPRAHSYSVKSMDGRARCHTCRGAGAGREPGRGQAAGARIGGRPAARCPSTEAHAPPIWKEPVCLLHSILRQGPQSTAIRPLRRRTKHPRRVKNPDQPHDSRPCSITPPRAAAKKSDQPPPCRHPSVDVSAHPSPWQGDQAAGASRGRRQPSGQRPRCPSARLPVPRIAGAIAAAHTIWREGGAPRAGRTEFPPRIARRRKRAGGAQTPEIGACKSARRVVE